MPYANLNPDFTEEEFETAMEDLKNFEGRMPFLVNLTPLEKKAYFNLGSKSELFIQKAFNYYQNNPNLQTPLISFSDWRNDYEVYKRLVSLLAKLRTLEEAVSDTVIALKQENMQAARVFYGHAQMAATQNVVGTDTIVADMQSLLPGLRQYRKKNKEAKRGE